jgi:tRNA(fMet)-specific endonuclease VapC
MNLKYLLDTNIFSAAMRPSPNPTVIEKLNIHKSEIAAATVVIHELLHGCWRLPESRKREAFLDYINNSVLKLPILNYDLSAAKWHAQERARLSKIGKPPAFADGQIASIAFSNDLVLVTNNISDFRDFQDLKLENWFDDEQNDASVGG